VNTPSLPPRLASIDRSQLLLHSIDVERLIDEDHSARAIWLIGGHDTYPRSYFEENICILEGVCRQNLEDKGTRRADQHHRVKEEPSLKTNPRIPSA
jgi:hypothetical protein